MKNFGTALIALLLLGVAIAPCINFNVVKASNQNDLVEMTTEACGIPGLQPQTVKLTTQQACEVEALFAEIKHSLDKAKTREETVAIFTDAVAKLDEYGLLGDVSVQQAQRLVKGGYQDQQAMNLYKTIQGKSQIFNDSNFLCLIAGETKETRLYSLAETGCSVLCYFLFGLYIIAHMFVDDPAALYKVISGLQSTSNFYHTLNSARIIGTGRIAFGNSHASSLPPPYRFNPAVGWVTTQGILGKKSWNGSFYGALMPIVTFDSPSYNYYIGAMGFLGIKITHAGGSFFFLGSALRVKLA
jgi:hypothetical protein